MLRQVQRGAPLAPVTKEMLASAKARNALQDSVNQVQLAKNLPPDVLRRFVRAKAEVAGRQPHRNTLPAFEDVHLDHAGRIWLGAPRALDTDVREWKVLDAAFHPLATLPLPAPAKILDVGRDRILLLLRDEMDAETVQLYSIEQG